VVAVILENFTSLGNLNEELVSVNDIEEFKVVWGVLDPDADGMIPARDLPNLVLRLTPPLGLKGTRQALRSKAFRFCLSLGLTQTNGEVAFKPVLDALIHRNYAEKNVPLSGEDGQTPTAVEQVLLTRSEKVTSIDVSVMVRQSTGISQPLTARRYEMSKILAEELLNRWVRRKRAQCGASDHGRGGSREPGPMLTKPEPLPPPPNALSA
jgi:hypothetical protein